MSIHTKTIIFVVGAMLGIICGEVSSYASEVALVGLLLGSIQMILYFVSKKFDQGRKEMSDVYDVAHFFSLSLLTSLFCFGLFVGVLRSQLVEEKMNFVCEKICTFDARIVSSPETKNEYQTFNVRPLTASSSVYDILVRTTLYPKYRIGDTLLLTGRVTVPKIIFPHEGAKNNNRSFDYASYLQAKNIGSEITYPKTELRDTEAYSLEDVLGRWKENLITRIDTNVGEPASSLASGMLFGASSMSGELLQTFRIAGLSHIVVLSGFNIIIVIASILFVLAFLPLVLRIVLASCSVIIFVMMVGASPSIVRATLMAFIALLAMFTGRPYVAKQALILSLFAIVMYEPYALLHDVSLHLSFLATMGLVYMSGPIDSLFKKYFPSLQISSLKEILITTLSAYFATLPYVMYTFGTVSLYALIANILIVPFVPLAMLLSFLVVVSSYLSSAVSSLFGFMDTLFINVMIWIAKGIESLPFSSVTFTLSFAGMLFMYLFIFIICYTLLCREKDETGSRDEEGNLTGIISY